MNNRWINILLICFLIITSCNKEVVIIERKGELRIYPSLVINQTRNIVDGETIIIREESCLDKFETKIYFYRMEI